MTRARAHTRKAELLQQRSNIAFVIIDAETRGCDALEIDAPPSHNAVDAPVGTRFDNAGELGFLGRQSRGVGPLAQASRSPSGTAPYEPMNPVAQRLPIHAADPGRIGAVHSVQDRRQ